MQPCVIRGTTGGYVDMKNRTALLSIILGTLSGACAAPARVGLPIPELIKELRATDGCLGVDACRWSSGRQSIAAWFKDKSSAQRWYVNQAHQRVLREHFEADDVRGKGLEHVPDGSGPIFVIATLTPSRTKSLANIDVSLSQISIELFAPLPGGMELGGRLSPAGFEVPHMHKIEPRPVAPGS
jgi:hypothetical protein